MSQTISLNGVYRNHKINGVGMHNPHNNRNFNEDETKHFINMIDEYIKPNIEKFKRFDLIMYDYNNNKDWRDKKIQLDTNFINSYSSKELVTYFLMLFND